MKNYTKEGQKLPLFGIGPYLISGISLLSIAGLVMSGNILSSGLLDGVWALVSRIAGSMEIEELGCPEIAHIFCENDIYAYAYLKGIVFERSQTLGTGGTKCDFYLYKTK